jgi:hypothetical protein
LYAAHDPKVNHAVVLVSLLERSASARRSARKRSQPCGKASA